MASIISNNCKSHFQCISTEKPINLKRTVREITRPLPSDALCNLGKPREIFMFLAFSGRAFKRDLAFGGYSDWSFLCISLQLLPSLFHCFKKKTLLRVWVSDLVCWNYVWFEPTYVSNFYMRKFKNSVYTYTQWYLSIVKYDVRLMRMIKGTPFYLYCLSFNRPAVSCSKRSAPLSQIGSWSILDKSLTIWIPSTFAFAWIGNCLSITSTLSVENVILLLSCKVA